VEGKEEREERGRKDELVDRRVFAARDRGSSGQVRDVGERKMYSLLLQIIEVPLLQIHLGRGERGWVFGEEGVEGSTFPPEHAPSNDVGDASRSQICSDQNKELSDRK